MYTRAALLDVHARTHRSLQGLLDHCAGLAPEDLTRPLEGFGAGTILRELQHTIGAERYWLGVLRGEMLVDEDEADRASIEALRAFRERVAKDTVAYLEAASDDEINARREVTTYGDRQVELVPAHVVMRTQTHVFQHQGRIGAMCRRLGHPVPAGLDFPLR